MAEEPVPGSAWEPPEFISAGYTEHSPPETLPADAVRALCVF